jgi:hypothetical protein
VLAAPANSLAAVCNSNLGLETIPITCYLPVDHERLEGRVTFAGKRWRSLFAVRSDLTRLFKIARIVRCSPPVIIGPGPIRRSMFAHSCFNTEEFGK